MVRAILQAQYPQGYWMHPGVGCSPRYRATIWQLLILAQLGMGRCEALDRAVEYVTEANQLRDGPFRVSKEPGDTPLGLNGSMLWALETLGYGNLLCVREAWSWLARRATENRLDAGEAVKVLWAANAAPPGRAAGAAERASRAAAAALLSTPPPRWTGHLRRSRLTFPLLEATDRLQWLEVLTEAGHADDERLSEARSWLRSRRLPGGAWPLERVPGKMWADVGKVGEPNKWVTIRALAVTHGTKACAL